MLSPEELMKPRFKVIIDYPHSPYKIGDVIDFGDGYSTKKMTETPYDDTWGETNYASNHYDEDEFRKYPALFQPLAWWEERKPEDMPAYLKLNDKILKVESWDYDAEDDLYFASEEDGKGYMPWNTIPATEADYLTYKNKNNG